MSDNILLQVDQLCFGYTHSKVPIGEKLSFFVREAEIFALVGESGCGKSLTGLCLIDLLPRGISIFSGAIKLGAQNILDFSPQHRRLLRGKTIAMVFQDPMTALNPVFTVGDQVKEVLVLHQGLSPKEAWERAAELFYMVGIPSPKERLRSYPHELSGGMRQRVMLAMALAGQPQLLIADEPTTALDVTIQAQILDLLQEIRQKQGLSVFLISHDLGVVAETADRAAVMYAGRLVEEAKVEELFKASKHPYTQALLEALPRPGVKRLASLPGRVPPPGRRPKGCKFADRCVLALSCCQEEEPPWREIAPGHKVRCFRV